MIEISELEKRWLHDRRFDCQNKKDVVELTQSVRAAFDASERIRSRKENQQNVIYKELGCLSADENDDDDSDAPNVPARGKKSHVVGAKRQDESEQNRRPLSIRRKVSL